MLKETKKSIQSEAKTVDTQKWLNYKATETTDL